MMMQYQRQQLVDGTLPLPILRKSPSTHMEATPSLFSSQKKSPTTNLLSKLHQKKQLGTSQSAPGVSNGVYYLTDPTTGTSYLTLLNGSNVLISGAGFKSPAPRHNQGGLFPVSVNHPHRQNQKRKLSRNRDAGSGESLVSENGMFPAKNLVILPELPGASILQGASENDPGGWNKVFEKLAAGQESKGVTKTGRKSDERTENARVTTARTTKENSHSSSKLDFDQDDDWLRQEGASRADTFKRKAILDRFEQEMKSCQEAIQQLLQEERGGLQTRALLTPSHSKPSSPDGSAAGSLKKGLTVAGGEGQGLGVFNTQGRFPTLDRRKKQASRLRLNNRSHKHMTQQDGSSHKPSSFLSNLRDNVFGPGAGGGSKSADSANSSVQPLIPNDVLTAMLEAKYDKIMQRRNDYELYYFLARRYGPLSEEEFFMTERPGKLYVLFISNASKRIAHYWRNRANSYIMQMQAGNSGFWEQGQICKSIKQLKELSNQTPASPQRGVCLSMNDEEETLVLPLSSRAARPIARKESLPLISVAPITVTPQTAWTNERRTVLERTTPRFRSPRSHSSSCTDLSPRETPQNHTLPGRLSARGDFRTLESSVSLPTLAAKEPSTENIYKKEAAVTIQSFMRMCGKKIKYQKIQSLCHHNMLKRSIRFWSCQAAQDHRVRVFVSARWDKQRTLFFLEWKMYLARVSQQREGILHVHLIRKSQKLKRHIFGALVTFAKAMQDPDNEIRMKMFPQFYQWRNYTRRRKRDAGIIKLQAHVRRRLAQDRYRKILILKLALQRLVGMRRLMKRLEARKKMEVERYIMEHRDLATQILVKNEMQRVKQLQEECNNAEHREYENYHAWLKTHEGKELLKFEITRAAQEINEPGVIDDSLIPKARQMANQRLLQQRLDTARANATHNFELRKPAPFKCADPNCGDTFVLREHYQSHVQTDPAHIDIGNFSDLHLTLMDFHEGIHVLYKFICEHKKAKEALCLRMWKAVVDWKQYSSDSPDFRPLARQLFYTYISGDSKPCLSHIIISDKDEQDIALHFQQFDHMKNHDANSFTHKYFKRKNNSTLQIPLCAGVFDNAQWLSFTYLFENIWNDFAKSDEGRIYLETREAHAHEYLELGTQQFLAERKEKYLSEARELIKEAKEKHVKRREDEFFQANFSKGKDRKLSKLLNKF